MSRDTRRGDVRRRAGLPEAPIQKQRRYGMRARWRRVVMVLVTIGMLVSGALAGLVAFAALTLPNVDGIDKATGTIRILDAHNQLIAEVGLDSVQRHDVKLAQISPHMLDAIVAAEDRNFYNEGALDVPRIGKALVVDVLLRRPAQGASTITQQLAKQAFYGSDAAKSPLRKLREAILAKELDDKYTKGEILEKYLNISYFGENAYGIQDAAKRFFGKDAINLTIGESALLAGLVQAPSAYDPRKDPTAAYGRMSYVLDGLVKIGKATAAETAPLDPLSADPNIAKAAQAALQADLSKGVRTASTGPAPHFAQYIQDQLRDICSEDTGQLNTGLTVYTTLDLSIQAKANNAVGNGVNKLKAYGANNGALLMIDPRTGAITAMVGSADFNNDSIAGQYNVTLASRRPGSSFKPYVYETGFINGLVKPDTILQDTANESRNLGGVQDFDRSYLGNITAAKSLLNSRNISTEQAMQKAGVDNVINFATSLGITSPLEHNASTAIGTSAVRMIDHTGAYAAFANGGIKVKPYGISKIINAQGDGVCNYHPPATAGQVMTPQQAWTMTNILRGYQKKWNIPFKYDTAGKSGTTDQFVDAWYMVYTPGWVVATWAGHTSGTDPAEHAMNGLFGTTEATYIAAPFVNSLSTPEKFVPVQGAMSDCDPNDSTPGQLPTSCPTPTPSPTAVPTDTPEPTPTDGPTLPPVPTACPTVEPTGTPPATAPPPIVC